MHFEVKNFRTDQGNLAGKIHWIKVFREQAFLTLREAKDVCDFCYDDFMRHPVCVLDTNRFPQFKFLENNVRILQGRCDVVRVANPSFKETDSEVDQILAKIGAKINKPSKSADDILKQTAITLIRGGHIRHAKGVLEILIK